MNNTLTTSMGPVAAPVDVVQLQQELAAVRTQLDSLQKLIDRKPQYQVSYAQQLFLRNLGMVNSPNVQAAWDATEQQLKFLESKGIL